tara:strand:- start:476 stop:1771 length:1296 start_codon:yes stop_codon:yes gene_type:complete
MKISSIIKKLYPFDYSIVGDGNDLAIKEFKKLLPFKVHNFTSGKIYNGWKIPHKWILKKAQIKENGKTIFDAKQKKFGVPVNSKSFKGFVSLEKLKRNIFYSKKLPNATPYNWTGLYRYKKKDWGFCMSKKEFNKINKKKYFVDIETIQKKGKMKVLEFTLKGSNKDTIIINAHNCHPFQANDDISGCAVGIKLFQMLRKIKKRKFTYTLLIAPELVGPIFWLKKNSKKVKNFKHAILLKSVGNKNSLKLQHSVNQNSEIDKLAIKYLKDLGEKYSKGKFRTIYGNDEIVFDSTGYKINTISLTRFPFKEYHTDMDTPERLSEVKLEKTYELIKKIILDFEREIRFRNKYRGVISLSNPKYNLYLTAESPGIDKKKYTKEMKKWNLLMNNLPRFVDNGMSLREIAKYHSLNYKNVFSYFKKWENKKLIEII